MQSFHTPRSRFIARASLIAPIAAVMLVLMATAVSAAPPPIRVHVHFQGARIQFTDCAPIVPPVDTLCHASDFSTRQFDTHVGSHYETFADINGGVANITVHPNGTFDVGAVIATGQLVLRRADMGGLDRAGLHATVPMSDGTDAILDVTLTGDGPENPFTIPGQIVPQPDCPNGFAEETLNRVYRGTTSVGTLTFHGITQVRTDVVLGAFLLQERDDGVCI